MKAKLAAGLLFFCLGAWAEPAPLIRVIRGGNSLPPYAETQAPLAVLGMFSVTGIPESWLVEEHVSFESIESVDNDISLYLSKRTVETSSADEILPPSRTVIALYRAGLSYRPDEAEKNLPKARYMMVTIYRVRPGSDAGFSELVALRRARMDSINIDRPEMAYQVISGAAAGTYLFLSPIGSLKSLDDGLAKTPIYAQGVKEAAATAGQKLVADSEIGHEILLFRLDPRISYVPQDFAAADPDFWAGRSRR